MKTTVCEIKGCHNSETVRVIERCNSVREARQVAEKRNQSAADGLGLSLDAFYERQAGGEGVTGVVKGHQVEDGNSVKSVEWV